MEFLTTFTSDGMALTGLISRAARARALVVHVHGYGGNFYSHPFLKVMHDVYPARGVSFVSSELRTTGYLAEQYTDDGVRYVGAALSDHDEVLGDISSIIELVSEDAPRLVLQGHSFGTNLVREYAFDHPELDAAVFLCPGDSGVLQTAFEADQEVPPLGDVGEIRWDLFGIRFEGHSYPIPVFPAPFQRLLTSRVFGSWSRDRPPLTTACLVVQGDLDPIGRMGSVGSPRTLKRLLPNHTLVRVPGARHTLRGAELVVCEAVLDWLGEH